MVGNDELLGLFLVEDVDDDGVGEWSFFGLVDLSECLGVECVGAESIDGFGGEGD